MKTQSGNLIRFVIPIIFILIWGCDNGKLSNLKAEKILKAEYPRYITSIVPISDHSLSPRVPNELKLLSAKGLATYNYIPPGTRGYGCYGKLTESGSQYFVSKIDWDYVVMAVAKVEFDRVLGIREIPALNLSEVEYTEKITQLTPVGEIYNDIGIGKTYNETATFIKYNDGWRIEEISSNAKKIVIAEQKQKINNEGNVEGKFSGEWEGHETHVEIKLNSDGTYKIEMSAEGNTKEYVGYFDEGKLRYVGADYQGNKEVHYIVFSSSNCIKDGFYEYCKKNNPRK